MSSRQRRRAGFTLLEMVIVMSLLLILMAAGAMTAKHGNAAFRRNAANNSLDSKSARTLQRIVAAVRGASNGSLVPSPDPPFGSATLDFQHAVGYAAGAVVWGPTIRVALELAPGEVDNGVDDNGDGLIDEGIVVRVENPGELNERRIVLARGVREFLEGETPNGLDDNGNGLIDERGLSFDESRNLLTVWLSVERTGSEGEIMTRTLQTAIALRN